MTRHLNRLCGELPLLIEVVTIGEMPSPKSGTSVRYISGLMPFLDELDVDTDPVS